MEEAIRHPQAQYLAVTKDHGLRMLSTSGGAFTELARVILREGGVVFGAVWDDRLRVVHKWTDTECGLAEMRGSKYVVSDMANVYGPMEKFLADGRKVLFTGTPCQTAAIRRRFGYNPNLLVCALICMANMESSRWEKYVNRIECAAKSKVERVAHRFKIEGRRGSFMKVEFIDKTADFVEPLSKNKYWKELRTRPRRVCLSCQFRCGRHCADLQIGDFWGCEKFFPNIDNSSGVSAVLVYTSAGADLLSKSKLYCQQVEYWQISTCNPYLEEQYVPVSQIRVFSRKFLQMIAQIGKRIIK